MLLRIELEEPMRIIVDPTGFFGVGPTEFPADSLGVVGPRVEIVGMEESLGYAYGVCASDLEREIKGAHGDVEAMRKSIAF